jgi:hypothetical protein
MKGYLWLIGLLFGAGILTASPPANTRAQDCALEASEWAPRGTARTARPRITVTFASTCGAAIDPASIRMTVDEEDVMAAAEGTGPKVAVVYTPASALVEEEDHTVVVKIRDVKGTAGEKTWTFHIGDTYSR